jgi:hypothetical protein
MTSRDEDPRPENSTGPDADLPHVTEDEPRGAVNRELDDAVGQVRAPVPSESDVHREAQEAPDEAVASTGSTADTRDVGRRLPEKAAHSLWKVLAWVIATAIAGIGVLVGVLQYQANLEQRREDAEAAATATRKAEASAARESLEEACAQASDVFDSMISILRVGLAGAPPQDLDFPDFRIQLRELSEAANRTGSPLLREAASSVRSRFELLRPGADYPPEVQQQLLEGMIDFTVILGQCQAAGMPIPTVPPDVMPGEGSPGSAHIDTASLGLSVQPSPPGQDGAEITAVTPGSPAAQSGLVPGDVVVSAAGVLVATPDDLQRAVAEHSSGDVIQVGYMRDGTLLTLQMTL